ncbi:hypothetical protein CTI12_AA189240 [Artemisia annua]|uniref:Uncharacterized protein n=1 Tax=Artemisia annua TaxID=35608 RepID=A0A2U1P662_ARTAN|nr:hypothetical protein CTI12_AA189240 [Artemisia annua]
MGNFITTEEALVRHIDLYNSFRSSCRLPFSDKDHPISVMGRILRRRLISQRQNGAAGLGIKKHFLVEGAVKDCYVVMVNRI